MVIDVSVPIRFDYMEWMLVKSLIDDYDKEYTIKLNFQKCLYLDSSGLGMLLQLREYFGGKVIIYKPRPVVLSMIKTASFDKLFEIV